MAASPAITCPHCDKKFKPKVSVQGKKIKCPFCAHPFAVPGDSSDATVNDPPGKTMAEKKKANPDQAKAAPPAQTAPEAKNPDDEFDDNPDPYGVKDQDLTPRCPNCAKELANENAIICIYCGYNTLTREVSFTKKTVKTTAGRHFKYLLVPIGAATFLFSAVIFLLYYSAVSPYHVNNTMFEFTDHESMRMWSTVTILTWIWGSGLFCFKKFFEKPKPDEIVID